MREERKGGWQREGFEIGQQGEKTARRGRGGMEG